MPKWKHIFLTLALVEFVIGFSDLRPTTFFYLGRPLGAIFFGLFLIAQMLEKESALLDEQNRAAGLDQLEPVWNPGPTKNPHAKVATHPVPTMALSR
jgi:uncharacterized membrane protein YtjA (UPF0391 family)